MIGVIGCGNMAEAIVKGFHQKNQNTKFLTYTPSFIRAEKLAKAVEGKSVQNLAELQVADTVIIACKPQQLNDLAINIKSSGLDLSQTHLISILAATPIEIISEKLNASKISRVMPNTPSLVGLGMSLVLHSSAINTEEKKLVNDFFHACGEVQELPNEKLFDQVTTVSGSGPAYVFLFAKTMADQLVSWGLNPESSKKIVTQLFRGSSELMKSQEDLSLDELISKVTSKGGVTIEAVKSFESDGLDKLTMKALSCAFARSEEMRIEALLK